MPLVWGPTGRAVSIVVLVSCNTIRSRGNRDPRLGGVLDKLKSAPQTTDTGPLRQLQADVAKLSTENAGMRA